MVLTYVFIVVGYVMSLIGILIMIGVIKTYPIIFEDPILLLILIIVGEILTGKLILSLQ